MIAEAIGGFLLQAVLPILSDEAKQWLNGKVQRLAFDRAIVRAFGQFNEEHGALARSFFDETFLRNGVAPLLARFFEDRGKMPAADELIAAWEERYGLKASREPGAERAAARFVDLLDGELKKRETFQIFFSRRAEDTTATSTAATAASAAEIEALLREVLKEQKSFGERLRSGQVADALVLLSNAVGLFLAAVEARRSNRDWRYLEDEADDFHTQAIIRLRQSGYTQWTELDGDFTSSVRDYYDEVDAALTAGRDGQLEASAFFAAARDFRQRIRDKYLSVG